MTPIEALNYLWSNIGFCPDPDCLVCEQLNEAKVILEQTLIGLANTNKEAKKESN